MRPANERQHYIVESSLIGWMHTQKDPSTYDIITIEKLHGNSQMSDLFLDWFTPLVTCMTVKQVTEQININPFQVQSLPSTEQINP